MQPHFYAPVPQRPIAPLRPLAGWQSASAILIIVTTAVGLADVAGEWGAFPDDVWSVVVRTSSGAGSSPGSSSCGGCGSPAPTPR